MMNGPRWLTAITEVKPDRIHLRGYRIDALMGRVTFTQAIYLALIGELPLPKTTEMLDAILVSSIDHGATPPSTLVARTAASTGAPLNAAVAAGVLAINKHHGGAVENCMRMLYQALEMSEGDVADPSLAAAAVVDQYLVAGRRLPGFGHRLHTADPRVSRLFELARKLDIAAGGVVMIQALATEVGERTGRELPINVDGAIAALLVDMGLPLELANAFFILARVVGLIAHAHEETIRESPMRRIDASAHDYDGPRERRFPPDFDVDGEAEP